MSVQKGVIVILPWYRYRIAENHHVEDQCRLVCRKERSKLLISVHQNRLPSHLYFTRSSCYSITHTSRHSTSKQNYSVAGYLLCGICLFGRNATGRAAIVIVMKPLCGCTENNIANDWYIAQAISSVITHD